MAEPLARAIEKKIQEAPAAEQSKILTQQNLWPEFLTAKDLLQMPPDPTRWIWDRCLPAGGCSILAAKPKVGKSTLAVCLALSVARGMDFLRRPTQQGPVAYLSLDATLPEMAEIFIHFGLQESDPIFIHAGAAPRDAVAWIMHRVQQNGVKLVIIDTLQRLFRFQNVNDYSEVTNAMEPLLEQARIQNCHAMFTHHAKKDGADDLDSAIGSTAIRGLAYTYLHMKRLPDSDIRIFRTDQRGGKSFNEYAVGFDITGFMDLQGTREEVEVEQAEPGVMEWFAENPETTEREMRGGCPGQPKTMGRALRNLLKRNELERIGRGKRGDPFKYLVAAKLVAVSRSENPGRYSSFLPSSRDSGTSEKTRNDLQQKAPVISDTYSGLSESDIPEINQNKPETRNDSAINQKPATGKNADFFSRSTPLADKAMAEAEAYQKKKRDEEER